MQVGTFNELRFGPEAADGPGGAAPGAQPQALQGRERHPPPALSIRPLTHPQESLGRAFSATPPH